MMRISPVVLLTTIIFTFMGGPAFAEEAADSAPVEAPSAMGITVDIGFASAYVFRGANVFQEEKQSDQNMLLAPSVTWEIMDTGLMVGYWGAFQLNGDNKDTNIDVGLGMEQDLFLFYSLTLPHDIGLSLGVLGALYPAADEELAGTSMPTYIDPQVAVSYSTVVDLGLQLSYWFGVQDEIRDFSYLYVRPSVGKAISINDQTSLGASLGYGFKYFKEGNEDMSNIHDISLDVSATYSVLEWLYISPSVHAAWTDIENLDMGDELAYWGGLNVGATL